MRPAHVSYLDSRSQFEQNFYVLAQLLRSKRMSFYMEATTAATSLLKIKRSPNGRINLITIDAVARSTANGIEQMMIAKI